MLVIALGVLALLSVLAVTFVSLMKLELLASKNYVDGVKARLIAEGGMEEAITELKSRGGMEGITNINDDWVYANGDFGLPLEQATSRAGVALQGASRLLRTSYDGNLGGSYAQRGDRYKIEVIDAQCQFNLNNVFDGLTLDPAQREQNIYCRMLRCLGEAIRQLDSRANGVDPIARAQYPRNAPKYFGADAFLAYRQTLEGKQYSSKYQLNDILASDQDYIVLRPYVTTKSWMDPKAVTARNHDLGSVSAGIFTPREPFTDVLQVQPNPGELPAQRAPINVNLAPIAVLAANLAGLAGRATFYYYGDRTQTSMFQVVDSGTKYSYSGSGGVTVQEELIYGVTPVNVYFDPMGYSPGSSATGGGGGPPPPIIDGALQIAGMIDARRRTGASTSTTTAPPPSQQGPFRSFADWERWVDQTLTDGFFQNAKTKGGQPCFPLPNTCKIVNIDDSALVGTPSPAQIQQHPRFKPWFYDCLRAIIKSNMNPNGRASMVNPNLAVAMDVDKGNLLYFTQPGPPFSGNPTSTFQPTAAKFNTQTCEWCFGSKGIFEIISLGEVLNGDIKNPGQLDQQNPIAQAKILTVIQIFDQVSHTSQRDFERNGDPVSYKRPLSSTQTGGGYGGFGDELNQLPPGNGLRYGVVTYPYPKQFWDPRVGGWPGKPTPTPGDRYTAMMNGGSDDGWHAHDNTGYLELASRLTIKGRPNDTSVTSFGTMLFQLLFQDRHVRTPGNLTTQNPQDSFIADTANKTDQNTTPGFGCPDEAEATTGFAFPHPSRLPNSIPRPQGLADPCAVGGVYSGADERQLPYIYNLLMQPDGVYTTELRNLPLFYRASDSQSVGGQGTGLEGWPPGFTLQGDSVPNPQFAPGGGNWNGGNAWATPTGGCEFWYKPDFDWFVRQKQFGPAGTDPIDGFVPGASGGNLPDERFCGLVVSCHNVINQSVAQANWNQIPDKQPRATRGVELHVVRDTSGDLRVTRIYFEVCGQAGNELPWVSNIKPGVGGPDPASQIHLGSSAVVGSYMNFATTKPEYTWPPYEFQTIPQPWHDIKYARVDTWVPAATLMNWRAHEWHHVGVRWDDRTGLGQAASDSIQIYLDGVVATTITRQIPQPGPTISGPNGWYQAVINTPQQPIPPPTPPATTVVNPPTQLEPSFCRLNEDPSGNDPTVGRWPRDHLQVAGVSRRQATQGGLFKFNQKPDLPANGTVDDVRFYDGVAVKANGFADRYEEYGIWTNEFTADLSSRFVPGNDFLDLGNLQFTAYLPAYYGAARPAGGRGGAGSVLVKFKIVHADNSETTFTPVAGTFDGWQREFNDNSATAGFKLVSPTGQSAVVNRTDRLVYTILMYPARLQGGQLGGDSIDGNGFAVATPVLDDITLVYFLPTAKVLLKERMWD
jgi:type II secretory pathway component PulK